MSIEWWQAMGLFALAMIALAFYSPESAIAIILTLALAAVVIRLEQRKVT